MYLKCLSASKFKFIVKRTPNYSLACQGIDYTLWMISMAGGISKIMKIDFRFGVLFSFRLCLSFFGLGMNCGVVFTVKFGRVTQRKNAAKVICSMSLCNIFYLLFVIIFAVPMR